MTKSLGQLIKFFLYGLLIITTLLSVGVLFWWRCPLELLSNFRVYYLLLAGVLAIAFSIYQVKGFRTWLPLWVSLAYAVIS
ncbi:hypothetical protein ACKFKF_11430 [Phormidesmis sp. 146-12]